MMRNGNENPNFMTRGENQGIPHHQQLDLPRGGNTIGGGNNQNNNPHGFNPNRPNQ